MPAKSPSKKTPSKRTDLASLPVPPWEPYFRKLWEWGCWKTSARYGEDSAGTRMAFKRLADAGVDGGLSSTRRNQLAAFVFHIDLVRWLERNETDLSVPADERQVGPEYRPFVKALKRSRAQARLLSSRAERVRRAIRELLGYWEEVALSNPLFAQDTQDIYSLTEQLEALERMAANLPFPMRLEPGDPDPSAPPKPDLRRTELMCALYGFFVSGCALGRREAEVRVGKLGKSLWDWRVDVVEHRKGGISRGCDAVRKAVIRR